MKTLLSFALAFCLLTLTSCAYLKGTAIPAAKETASKKITQVIVKTGQCKAEAVVKADVDELLKIEADKSIVVKALAEEKPAGVQAQSVASEICKAAASLALPALLDKGVPAKWECELTDLNSKVKLLAAQACESVL